jgi:hypothetical protein
MDNQKKKISLFFFPSTQNSTTQKPKTFHCVSIAQVVFFFLWFIDFNRPDIAHGTQPKIVSLDTKASGGGPFSLLKTNTDQF